MSSKTIALVAIVTASFFWATAGVVAKPLLQIFDPFPLAFWRFLFASLTIMPIFLYQNKQAVTVELLKNIIPISLFSTANISLFYVGLKTTTANASAIIYTTTPLITAVLARFLIGEKLTSQKLGGIILGFLGALTIVFLPLLEKGQTFTGDLTGNLFILAASFTWAVYTIGSRRLISAKNYSPLAVSTISIVTSAVIFFLVSLIFPQRDYLTPLQTPANLIGIIHLAILVTVLTYLLYQWAIKHSSATTASLSNYIQPVFGIILAIIFLGEKLTAGFIVGSLLVFGGVFLATGSQTFKELRRLLTNIK